MISQNNQTAFKVQKTVSEQINKDIKGKNGVEELLICHMPSFCNYSFMETKWDIGVTI